MTAVRAARIESPVLPLLTVLLTLVGHQSANPDWTMMKVASSWLLAYMIIMAVRALAVRAGAFRYDIWAEHNPVPLCPPADGGDL